VRNRNDVDFVCGHDEIELSCPDRVA